MAAGQTTFANMAGGNGFLGRITTLERDVSFLKQKVEEDARWKHLLENWMLENFAFDLRAMLLNKTSSTGGVTLPKKSHGQQSNKSTTVTNLNEEKPQRPQRTTRKPEPLGMAEEDFSDEHDDVEENRNYGERDNEEKERGGTNVGGALQGSFGDEIEVNLDPKDLFIIPHSLKGVTKQEPRNYDSDNEFCPENEVEASAGSGSDSNSSADYEAELQRKKSARMEWVLVGTYPNLESYKANFNTREWGLSTKAATPKLTKIYFYCKECRKNGPGRLQIRYLSEDTEVQVFKNTAIHDHSRKKHLSWEMKSEIVTLYKAGMKSSSQVLQAVKISKPDMRMPTLKQILTVLKPHRRLDRIADFKAKKKAKKEKDKTKDKIKKLIPPTDIIASLGSGPNLTISGFTSTSGFGGSASVPATSTSLVFGVSGGGGQGQTPYGSFNQQINNPQLPGQEYNSSNPPVLVQTHFHHHHL